MVINRLSVFVSGFGVGFGLVHTMLVVSGRYRMFQMFRGRRLMTVLLCARSANMFDQRRLAVELTAASASSAAAEIAASAPMRGR
jgi:hypothetical protein